MWIQGSVALDFGADRDRLEQALRLIVEAVGKDPARAVEMFHPFDTHLRSHMSVEEQLLFAVFEQRTGLRDVGPTVTLTQTHRQIDRRLDELTHAFATHQDPQQIVTRLGQLRVLIEDQTVQEEQVFYPSCDQTLNPEEVQAALVALQALNAPH